MMIIIIMIIINCAKCQIFENQAGKKYANIIKEESYKDIYLI